MDVSGIADDRLGIAHRTLREGTSFIGSAPRRIPPGAVCGGNLLGDMVDVRLLANGLRELDRFLGVLIEEVAERLGSASHDPHAFARLRNTPNKLRLVRGMMNVESPDHRWLLAVGRLRVCLHHCGGEVRSPGHPAAFALAGCQIVASRDSTSPRERLVLTSGALDTISGIYRRVGDDLVAELGKWSRLAA